MYTEKFGHLTPMAAPGTITTTATGVATPTYAVMSQCRLNRMVAVVTTTISTTSNVAIQYIYRPTAGSATNQVVLGTLTINGNVAAGNAVYKDVEPSQALVPGGQLVYNVSVAATSAGVVVCGQEVVDDPQNAKAQSTMSASL